MALGMSFYSVVIPISNFKKCKDIKSLKEAMERTPVIGARAHDEYLFKESAMGTYGVEMLVDFWESQGLTPYVETNNKIQWKDLCVVVVYSGATAQCDWIEYDRETVSVWLKGKPKGEIIRATSQNQQVSDVDFFEKLKELEQSRAISIGIDSNRALRYLGNSYIVKIVLDTLVIVGTITWLYFIFKFEFITAISLFLLVGGYSIALRKVTTQWLIYKALNDIALFDEMYDSRTVTIRINETGEVIYNPMRWRPNIWDI